MSKDSDSDTLAVDRYERFIEVVQRLLTTLNYVQAEGDDAAGRADLARRNADVIGRHVRGVQTAFDEFRKT